MATINLDNVYNYIDDMVESFPGEFLGQLISTHEYKMERCAAVLQTLGQIEGLDGTAYKRKLKEHKKLYDIYNRYFAGIFDEDKK